MVTGLNKFIGVFPDLVTDIPKLPQFFAETLLHLFNMSAVYANDIQWIAPVNAEDPDELIFIEESYKLMALLLCEMHKEGTSWRDVVKWYTKFAQSSFVADYHRIEEAGLFKDISAEILNAEDQRAILIPLLDQKPGDSKDTEVEAALAKYSQ
jgi:hypothetical protein